MRKTIGLLAVLLCAFSATAAPVKVAGMSRAEFDKLPPDALLDVGGRTLTKAALMAQVGAAKTGASPVVSKIDATKDVAKFAEAEKGRVSAQNAAIKAKRRRPEVSKVATPPTRTIPIINSVEPQVIEPGFGVLVKGIGFGADAGEVRIVGNFPGGSYALKTCYQGGICTWDPAEIVGEVQFIAGVQDQNASLVVVTKSGATSNRFPVQFRAAREKSCMKLVRGSDIHLMPGSDGNCVDHRFGERSTGLRCWHHARLIAAGTDGVSLNLENGWVLAAYGLSFSSSGGGFVLPMVSFTSGSPSMSAVMNWLVLPERPGLDGQVDWWLETCAVGPVGVSFR